MPILPLFAPNNIDEYFYGRTVEINMINSYFNSDNKGFQPLIIKGNRGIGKTFLIKKILNFHKDNYLTIYFDISRIANNEEFFSEELIVKNLFSLIREELAEKFKDSINFSEIKKLLQMVQLDDEYNIREVCEILDIPLQSDFSDTQNLSNFVLEFPQKFLNKFTNDINGFIIAIDEFHLINDLDNPKEFLSMISKINKSQDDVYYIFSSYNLNIFNFFKDNNVSSKPININLQAFTVDETNTYFKEVIPEINFTDDGFKKFYNYTKGIPACINSFANLLSSHQTYDDKLISKTFILKTNQVLVDWLDLWANLNKVEKNIVVVIIENEGLNKDLLINDLEFSRSTIIKYLNALEEKMLIESTVNNNYIISDEMFKSLLLFKKETLGYILI